MHSIQMTFSASNQKLQSGHFIGTLTDLIVYIMKVILAIPAAGLLLSSAILPYSASDLSPIPAESKPPLEEKSPSMWVDAASY